MVLGGCFWKMKNCQIRELYLTVNMSEAALILKILRTASHPCWNYGPSNLLFHFSDSCMDHVNKTQTENQKTSWDSWQTQSWLGTYLNARFSNFSCFFTIPSLFLQCIYYICFSPILTSVNLFLFILFLMLLETASSTSSSQLKFCWCWSEKYFFTNFLMFTTN